MPPRAAPGGAEIRRPGHWLGRLLEQPPLLKNRLPGLEAFRGQSIAVVNLPICLDAPCEARSRADQDSNVLAHEASAGIHAGALDDNMLGADRDVMRQLETIVGIVKLAGIGRRSIPEGGYSPCLTCAISPASFSAVPFTSYFAAF